MFHFHYERTPGGVTASLVNLGGTPLTATIELLAPSNSRAAVCRVNGIPTTTAQPGKRYGRPSLRVTRELLPGVELRVAIDGQQG
jgi:hypothetical protein